MKKIVSVSLALMLTVCMILPILPVSAAKLGDKKLYDELKEIPYMSEVYSSPEEKLETMTLAAENEKYALYIQEYTAEVCVVDKITGQTLFTNPYDVADVDGASGNKYELLSQVIISYSSNTGESGMFNSYSDAAASQQIKIKQIRNGVRVEYTLGEAIKKRVVPYQIEKENFNEKILRPFYESTNKSELSFDDYLKLKFSSKLEDQAAATAAEDFNFGRFVSFYTLYDLADPSLTAREQSSILTTYPITEKLAIYVLDEDIKTVDLTLLEENIRDYTEYSLDDMLADHDEVGYVMEDGSPPIFKMALEYTLEDEGFQVRLPARGISFDASTYTLQTIQILPYMGAGRIGHEGAVRTDEGYNFIPDGSGATIQFAHNSATMVASTMFGEDYGFYSSANAATASYQTWRAPVYGTVMTSHMTIPQEAKDVEGNPVLDEEGKPVMADPLEKEVKQGYVAFITEGESLTRIAATNTLCISTDDTGKEAKNSFHAISPTFFARQTDSYPLDGITVSGKEAVYTKAIERKYVGNYTIKYRMLLNDDASYVGMANVYRSYLEKNGVLKKLENQKEDINLYLDLLGAVDTTKTVFGVPVDAMAELTTFENAKTILDELKKAGVAGQVIRYIGWANGGLTATAPAKIKIEKCLGGEDGLKDLISYVQKQGNQIYLDMNFSYVKATDMFDGFDKGKDTAKTIDGKAAYYQTYNPIVQAYNTQVAYVISAKTIDSYYENITEKYTDLFGDGGKTLSVGSLGYALNSSQDESFPLNREDAKNYTMSSMENISKDFDSVLVEKGNHYTWKYVDTILDIPLDSSNRIDTTAEVPFLAILLHGYMNYTGEALNMAGDYEYTLLKTIESGANPYFVVAYDNIAELKVNGYSEYYAVHYEQWKDRIIEKYLELNKVLAPLQDKLIVNHEILAKNVVKVSYENGTAIYLNYNNFAVTVDSFAISAMGYQVVEA